MFWLAMTQVGAFVGQVLVTPVRDHRQRRVLL